MNGPLILALPSKGRLMEQCARHFAEVGIRLIRSGPARGYQGELDGLAGIEVAFVSSSEIAQLLTRGAAHLGITGEDLVRESLANADDRLTFVSKLGFGRADVVVAVPACWIDVRRVADLEEMAVLYHRTHGRRVRVATKYRNLTRRFLTSHGVTNYRIVDSLGATEGTPAAGLADLIVDITTTGATLRANGLKVLDDGVILESEANLIASKAAPWTPAARKVEAEFKHRLRL
jgi:ATP phosphoribosyltransferase